jgi:fatty-acyl-CoA synthase
VRASKHRERDLSSVETLLLTGATVRAMHVPLTLLDFLERAELVYGERTAVVDEPRPPGGGLGRITYAQLGAMARGLAVALDERGLEAGARVAIVSPNAARFVAALFGVSAFGRVLVPVNFRLNADEIRYIVEHSGATALLVDAELEELVGDVPIAHRLIMGSASDAALFGRRDAAPRHVVVDEAATVSINYTSGTTARPKGVQLSHRSCWLNAVTFGWHIAITDRDVYLHTLPMFHCNGWGLPYALTAMGVRQVVIRKIDGAEILRRIEAEGVTLLSGAPAVVAAVLDAAAERRARGESVPGRGTVRMVVAGAPPPSKTIERVQTELGWELIQIYGLTETSPLLTINRAPAEWDDLPPPDRAQRMSRAGVPAVGVRIAVSPGGELLARSNHVFDGYYEQPDETGRAIVDGWFHTGDGGHLDCAYAVITDRKKDVIISGGENVSSIEVEDCLYQHPAVAEAAVIGVPHEKWGETVFACVVVRPGVTTTPRELIEHCRERLAHFKCPTTIELRDSLPRTATGKLQKFRLREPYWAGRPRGVN